MEAQSPRPGMAEGSVNRCGGEDGSPITMRRGSSMAHRPRLAGTLGLHFGASNLRSPAKRPAPHDPPAKPGPSLTCRAEVAASLHADAVVVEPSTSAGYAVTTRPLRFELARHFPLAWQALEHAEVLAEEIGGRVVDRTGVVA